MLTRYTLTIGGTETVIGDECLRNWDEISFSLKRSDYSGVVRSFSTEFEFVGKAYDLIYAEYAANGLLAEVSVAVYTITNRHTWEKQFEAPLDFSTLAFDGHTLSVSALDNSLAALIKAKKSTKYEFAVDDLDPSVGILPVIQMHNSCFWVFKDFQNSEIMDLTVDNDSEVFTNDYVQQDDEVGESSSETNSFFIEGVKYGADIDLTWDITMRAYLNAGNYGSTSVSQGDDEPIISVQLRVKLNDADYYDVLDTLFEHSLLRIVKDGVEYHRLVANRMEAWPSLARLKSAATKQLKGMFGIVGDYTSPDTDNYWTMNTVYEFDGSDWVDMGSPDVYYQDIRHTGSMTVKASDYGAGCYLGLYMRTHDANGEAITIGIPAKEGSSLVARWADPTASETTTRDVVAPVDLINAIVGEICEGATATIAEGSEVLAQTWLAAGESLRMISGAKIYSTFTEFADWMSVMFGYTYTIDDDSKVVAFVPRTEVFKAEVVKVLENVRDVEYSIEEGLIHSSVKAGQEVVDYSEINGRDQWFLNEYATGVSLADSTLNLTCKYRFDCYGIEYTMRQAGETTTDDITDEKVFFVRLDSDMQAVTTTSISGTINEVYNADFSSLSVIEANAGYIAAMHVPLKLERTSTSGNDDLTIGGVPIIANADISGRMFTEGEVKLTTDDTDMPPDLHGLVEFEWGTYTVRGFIKEAEARYGKINGTEYTLIVYSISETGSEPEAADTEVVWSVDGEEATEDTGNPELTNPVDGDTIDMGGVTIGGSVSVIIQVRGKNLTEDLSVAISGKGFSVNKETIGYAAANDGLPLAKLKVSYDGTSSTGVTIVNTKGTLVISSGEVSAEVQLKVTQINLSNEEED